MPWLLFGLACGYFWLVGQALGFSLALTTGRATMLTGSRCAPKPLSALPMIEAFYGAEFLGARHPNRPSWLYLVLSIAALFGVEGPVMRVTVFEAAMAPMIGASIVAMDHDLDPPLVTLMLGVGIPLSFLTLPVWWYLLTLV